MGVRKCSSIQVTMDIYYGHLMKPVNSAEAVNSDALKKGRAKLTLPPTSKCHIKHAILFPFPPYHGHYLIKYSFYLIIKFHQIKKNQL